MFGNYDEQLHDLSNIDPLRFDNQFETNKSQYNLEFDDDEDETLFLKKGDKSKVKKHHVVMPDGWDEKKQMVCRQHFYIPKSKAKFKDAHGIEHPRWAEPFFRKEFKSFDEVFGKGLSAK